jgi:hypothetical protein
MKRKNYIWYSLSLWLNLGVNSLRTQEEAVSARAASAEDLK